MGKPSFAIDDLRAEQIRRVPVTASEHGWQLPDGTIFCAVFLPKSTRLSLPDWGFTTGPQSEDPPTGPKIFTTSFARQAGTLVATAPVPDPDDEAAGAARLAADLLAAFGPEARACRADLAAFVQTFLHHLLGGFTETDAAATLEMPRAERKLGRVRQIRIPPEQGLVPGRMLRALAGRARNVRNGQAKPIDEIWIRPLASAHARVEALLRLEAAEARTGLTLRNWIAAQPRIV